MIPAVIWRRNGLYSIEEYAEVNLSWPLLDSSILELMFRVSDAALYWHSRWMDTFVAAEVAMHDDGGDDRVLLV